MTAAAPPLPLATRLAYGVGQLAEGAKNGAFEFFLFFYYTQVLGLFLWLTAFSILTRFAMTLYFVPHMALGAELSRDYGERTTIVAFRAFFGLAGGLGAPIAGLAIWFRPTAEQPLGQLAAAAYPGFGATLAVGMAAAIWLCAACRPRWGCTWAPTSGASPASRSCRSRWARAPASWRACRSGRWWRAGSTRSRPS